MQTSLGKYRYSKGGGGLVLTISEARGLVVVHNGLVDSLDREHGAEIRIDMGNSSHHSGPDQSALVVIRGLREQ